LSTSFSIPTSGKEAIRTARAQTLLMKKVTQIAHMQRLAYEWRDAKVRVGLVPTMGYLHEGHLSLVKRARRAVGKHGAVVLSVYVNPTQFGPKEDLSRYPRNLARDLQLCRDAGVDVVFTPDDTQMYPGKGSSSYSTYVLEETLSRGMEGASRPGHFRGVTTVVAKLFNIVLPDVAVFGAKDFQQAVVVSRMARDLNFRVSIIVAPTIREPDGLALSSRNKYLEGELRAQATTLWKAIAMAQAVVRRSKRPVNSASLREQLQQFIERQPAARVDYIEFFDPVTLRPVAHAQRGSHMALAVSIGITRLIDNAPL
jgi:pantoate--beta-alanine ligase